MDVGATQDTGQDMSGPPDMHGPSPVSCPKCGLLLDGTAAFCSRCGASQNYGKAWYYHPVWVFILAFLVLGPFALYLVWKSRLMGATLKWIITVLILGYTVYCVYLVYTVTNSTVQEVIEFNRLLR